MKGKSLTILRVEVCQMSEILLVLFADFGAKGHRLFRLETTDGKLTLLIHLTLYQ